jgi:hypothetical protein
MKPGIIITAMAALALAVFAVAGAHASWWGGDVDQQLFGHLIIIEESGTGGVGGIGGVGGTGGVGGDGGPGGAGGAVRAVNTVTTTAAINGIAKGKPGRALVTGVLVFEDPPLPPEPDPRCTDKYEGQFPLFSEITRFEWGETYDDGSLLAGFVFPPGQGFCTDGTLSVADLTGLITGGTGRFEGASGTWRIEASSPTANTATTGTLTVDLN